MKNKTAVNQIEVTAQGHIQVRMTKEILDDGGAVISSTYHRTCIEVGGDIQAQLAFVNTHLEMMGWPSVSDGDIGRVSAIANAAWTAEIRAAWATVKARISIASTDAPQAAAKT